MKKLFISVLLLSYSTLALSYQYSEIIDTQRGTKAFDKFESYNLSGSYKGETITNGWRGKGPCSVTLWSKDNKITFVMSYFKTHVFPFPGATQVLPDPVWQMEIGEDTDKVETILTEDGLRRVEIDQRDYTDSKRVYPVKNIYFTLDEKKSLSSIAISEFTQNTIWNNSYNIVIDTACENLKKKQ